MTRFFANLFRTKPIGDLVKDDDGDGPKLARVLTARDVFFHGVAAIIGTGIFVLTGVAAAKHAGPGIILSFLLAGIACVFVSFAYAELASMIPKSGSAYTYAYATLGELVAFFIGWDLLLEYCVGSSAVAVGWSGYMQNILAGFGVHLPDYLAKAPADMPWQQVGLGVLCLVIAGVATRFKWASLPKWALAAALAVVGGVVLFKAAANITSIDLLAVLIIALINFFLVKGVKHTARMTAWFVVIKLAVIVLFIAIGMWHVQPANLVPFLPFGWSGVLTGAAVVFFAYIGFDAVSTLPEECKDPKRDMPKGIIGSLVVCGILYVVVAAIMVGVVKYNLFDPSLPSGAAPMATVLTSIGSSWGGALVSVGAMAGITSVLIVLLFGQSRVMMSMSRDGLLSPVFSRIHHRFRTPVWAIVIWGVVAAATSGLLPIGELAELTSIGTLAAFVLCCIGVMVLRRIEPERERKFKCPRLPGVVPVVTAASRLLPQSWRPKALAAGIWIADNWMPVLGAAFSLLLMCSLPMVTWIRFVGWMVIGLIIYFLYGRSHSKLAGAKG